MHAASLVRLRQAVRPTPHWPRRIEDGVTGFLDHVAIEPCSRSPSCGREHVVLRLDRCEQVSPHVHLDKDTIGLVRQRQGAFDEDSNNSFASEDRPEK